VEQKGVGTDSAKSFFRRSGSIGKIFVVKVGGVYAANFVRRVGPKKTADFMIHLIKFKTQKDFTVQGLKKVEETAVNNAKIFIEQSGMFPATIFVAKDFLTAASFIKVLGPVKTAKFISGKKRDDIIRVHDLASKISVDGISILVREFGAEKIANNVKSLQMQDGINAMRKRLAKLK